jgi:hypothetical protein
MHYLKSIITKSEEDFIVIFLRCFLATTSPTLSIRKKHSMANFHVDELGQLYFIDNGICNVYEKQKSTNRKNFE